jgi:hypothetical protein
METSAQYLKFAETCDHMAKLAKTERHRMTLKEMAEIWRKLAQEADTKDYSADTKDYSKSATLMLWVFPRRRLSGARGRCAAGFRCGLRPVPVIRDRGGRSHTTVHVRFAPKADK